MSFDSIYEEHKFSVHSMCKVSRKPNFSQYKNYLSLHFDKMMQFIKFHKSNKNSYENLPDINDDFLDKLYLNLTCINDLNKNDFYYSPKYVYEYVDDSITRRMPKEFINNVILGVSWINFKLVFYWYVKLIKIGYNHF